MKIIRRRISLLLASAAFLTSCSERRETDYPRPSAVLSATVEGGVCTYRWNGAPVSQEAIVNHGVNLLIGIMRSDDLRDQAEIHDGLYPEHDGPIYAGLHLRVAPVVHFPVSDRRFAVWRAPDFPT